MLGQVTLVVVSVLAACHSYPVANSPYLLPHAPLLLGQPSPHAVKVKPLLLPADAAAHSAKIAQFTQAGLPIPSSNGQYLFYYPGLSGAAPVVYAVKNGEKAEQEEEGGGSGGTSPLDGIYNFFVSWWETTTTKPAEEGSQENEPSKVSGDEGASSSPASANLESFDEDENKEPTSPSPIEPPKQPEQKLFLIGQPQFFGNYDALKNPTILKELGNNNPFPTILQTGGQQPFVWQNQFPAVPSDGAPGKAAADFQKILAAAKLKQSSEDEKEKSGGEAGFKATVTKKKTKKPALDADTVVVEALKLLPHAASDEEGESAEAVEAGEAEPSVAQVRPQAIALAGPSGVAAAAPVGTAVVGPGGLAVAAPSATAVAGPSGGEPPVIVPANRAQQAYISAQGQARFLERVSHDDADYSYSA